MNFTEKSTASAGILLYCPDRASVFLLFCDHAEMWDLPGGPVRAKAGEGDRDGDPAYASAKRTFRRQVGFELPPWPMVGRHESTDDAESYCTYLVEVPASRFEAVIRDARLDTEHTNAQWFRLNDLPLQMHPCLPDALAFFGLIPSAAAVYASAAADALWRAGLRATALRLVQANADDIEHVTGDQAVLYRNRRTGRSIAIPEERLARISVSAGQWAPGRYSAAHRMHDSGDYAYATLRQTLRELTNTLPVADEAAFHAHDQDDKERLAAVRARDDLRVAVTALESVLMQIQHIE